MTTALPRTLARIAVLALSLGQLAIGHTGVLAGALVAGFLVHDHRHALSLLSDGGHLDVVLHHDSERPREDAPLGLGAHQGDHVVHATPADSARESDRRPTPAPVLLVIAPPSPPATHAIGAPSGSAPVAALAAASALRTIVLRI